MRFRTLDAWRGISALLVAAFHFDAARFVVGPLFGSSIVRNAWVLVEFFFVLSGFVLAFNYGERIRVPVDARAFIWRRIGRLWPLNIAILLLLAGLQGAKWFADAGSAHAFAPPHTIGTLISNILLVQSLGPFDAGGWNPPGWSVSVEFYTYILFAAIVLLFRARWTRAAAIILMLSVVCQSFRLYPPLGPLLSCIIGFCSGALTWLVWSRWPTPARLAAPLEFGALALMTAFLLIFSGRTLYLLAPAVFSISVWCFATNAGPISRLLSHWSFQRLGDWSYSIYMTHWTILTAFNAGLVFAGRGLSRHDFAGAIVAPTVQPEVWDLTWTAFTVDAAGIAFLICVIMFSSQTYRFIERPARDAVNRWIARRTSLRRTTGLQPLSSGS